MTKIKKAVIPAAGFGTRFLPQTKAMPKEMMPLVDKPIIQRVVEELVDAGIETVIIVTGWHKRAVEDHFDNQYELEQKLRLAGKVKELGMVKRISNLAEFIYIRQKGPQGNATPILNARHIVGDEPFLVFWGDDFIDATPSRARQLVKAYEKYQSMIIGGVRAKSEEDYKKFGFVGGEELEKGVIKVKKIIEKPGKKEDSPSDLGSVSGFVFTKDLFPYLIKEKRRVEKGKEFVYTQAVQSAIDEEVPVYAVEIQNATYRDTGNKLEYLKTVVEYGLDHPEIGRDFKAYLDALTTKD